MTTGEGNGVGELMAIWDATRVDDAAVVSLKVAALDALSARVAVVDVDGTVLTVNHAWRAFAARPSMPPHARCKVGDDYLAAVDIATLEPVGTALPGGTAAGLRKVLGGDRVRFDCEYALRGAGGPQRFMLVATSLGGAGFGPAVVAHVELTGQQASENEFVATPTNLHDGLTGLPTRTLLRDRLVMALAQRSIDGRRTAVFVVGFDDVDVEAADLGASVADEVVAQMVARMQACVRPGDTIARVAANKFAFVFSAVRGEMGVQAIRMRLGRVLAEPVRVSGHVAPIWVKSTLGSALDGVEGSDPDGLLTAADEARSTGARQVAPGRRPVAS
ncbi:MAG TPA: diguanylate cyclase [Mycobacteriales bacterium]|jgi:diguanylate cyclase (GGDEF)-like protein|nr:diguanylate cyclase [Mycobacteriales bacterium]